MGTLSRVLHVEPAVDRPDLAGDVGRGISGQEVHAAGDFLRRPGRPTGIWLRTFASTLSRMAATILVATNPGVAVLTVTPMPSSLLVPALANR